MLEASTRFEIGQRNRAIIISLGTDRRHAQDRDKHSLRVVRVIAIVPFANQKRKRLFPCAVLCADH